LIMKDEERVYLRRQLTGIHFLTLTIGWPSSLQPASLNKQLITVHIVILKMEATCISETSVSVYTRLHVGTVKKTVSLNIVLIYKPRNWTDSLDKRPKRKKMNMRFGTWKVRRL
jgi:hypothetical protein